MQSPNYFVDLFQRWDEIWSPWTSLPNCEITHCIDPPKIPVDSNLREIKSEWTPVNSSKEYDCGGLEEFGRHTGFWKSNRSRSTFEIECKADGLYNFVNKRKNWPTCLQDVVCPEPPQIPNHPNYTLPSDYGHVVYQSMIYPQLTTNSNSTTNFTEIPRNYMANLTYYCGSAREFLNYDGSHEKSLSMSCQWNEQWTENTELLPCDWVACLEPPSPPSWTNLR